MTEMERKRRVMETDVRSVYSPMGLIVLIFTLVCGAGASPARAAWVPQTSGTTEDLRGVHFPVDATTGYAVGRVGTILKTSDGGANWVAQTSGTTENIRSVHFPVDTTTGYAVGNAGTILKTIDGGANWVAQTSGTTEDVRSVHFPVDATTGYVVGTAGTILKTIDGGTNWVAQTSGTANELRGVHFPVDATTGYAVGASGTILKTIDGGANWVAQTSGTANELRGVHFPVDATTGYAVGASGTILKTIDGGANWVAQTSGTANELRGVHFPVDATTGYAVGASGTILKTIDGGANWVAQTLGTADSLSLVHFPVDATTGYVVGVSGAILKTTWTPPTFTTAATGDGRIIWDGGSIDVGEDVVIQDNGKIVVAGYSWQIFPDFALWRYNADGTPDVSFGGGDGVVLTDFGGTDVARAVAIQVDGKIVVAGNSNADCAVARYNVHGSLDTSFDADGRVTTDLFGGADNCLDMAIQPDGKIVLSGNADNGATGVDYALVRYNADGSLDLPFGGGTARPRRTSAAAATTRGRPCSCSPTARSSWAAGGRRISPWVEHLASPSPASMPMAPWTCLLAATAPATDRSRLPPPSPCPSASPCNPTERSSGRAHVELPHRTLPSSA